MIMNEVHFYCPYCSKQVVNKSETNTISVNCPTCDYLPKDFLLKEERGISQLNTDNIKRNGYIKNIKKTDIENLF